MVRHHLRCGIDVWRRAPCQLDDSLYDARLGVCDKSDYDIYIGQSEMAMWMHVVSNRMCTLLCGWSLLAPLAILIGLEIECQLTMVRV
jgi:hypothetical protein